MGGFPIRPGSHYDRAIHQFRQDRLHRLYSAAGWVPIRCDEDCPCRGRARPDYPAPLDRRGRALIERPTVPRH
jgi:hypothetical protein